MSLSPRLPIKNGQSSLSPFSRLLDEVYQYSSYLDHPVRRKMGSFTPKFDMKELQDVYKLHGELPGIDQKDVEIEFTDASTLTIKGLVEGSYSHEPGTNMGANTESSGTENSDVQNENGENNGFNNRYWVMECNIGKFSRSFDFPEQVVQDAVKASMKNGILSIIVPKRKRQEGRKITNE